MSYRVIIRLCGVMFICFFDCALKCLLMGCVLHCLAILVGVYQHFTIYGLCIVVFSYYLGVCWGVYHFWVVRLLTFGLCFALFNDILGVCFSV